MPLEDADAVGTIPAEAPAQAPQRPPGWDDPNAPAPMQLAPWEQVEPTFRQQFPGADFDSLRRRYEAGRDLVNWRWRLRGAQEGGDPTTLAGGLAIGRTTARHTLDMFGVMGTAEDAAHEAARQRMEAGTPEPEDPYRMAMVERLRELDRQSQSTLGGQIWGDVQRLPGTAATFMLGGQAVAGIPGLTPAAGAGFATRAGLGAVRGTATMAINPEWIGEGIRNEIAHPERGVLENYGTPLTLRAIQGAVFGQLGEIAGGLLPGTGVARTAGQAAIGIGAGFAEQQVIDAVSSVIQGHNFDETGFGLFGDIVRGYRRGGAGRYDAALSNSARQAVTFAAFWALHRFGRQPEETRQPTPEQPAAIGGGPEAAAPEGQPTPEVPPGGPSAAPPEPGAPGAPGAQQGRVPAEVIQAWTDAVNHLRRRGMRDADIGRMMTDIPQKLYEAFSRNRNLTPEQARALYRNYPPGPLRDFAMKLVDTLEARAQRTAQPEEAPEQTQEPPRAQESAQQPQTAPEAQPEAPGGPLAGQVTPDVQQQLLEGQVAPRALGAPEPPPKPSSVFHITSYKDPSKSVGDAITMLERRGSSARPIDTWTNAENARGQAGKGAVTFEIDRSQWSGSVESRQGIDKLQSSKYPLPYEPALRSINYKGSEADPQFRRLQETVDKINSERADASLMREYGHSDALAPVELRATIAAPKTGKEAMFAADPATLGDAAKAAGLSPVQQQILASLVNGSTLVDAAKAAGLASRQAAFYHEGEIIRKFGLEHPISKLIHADWSAPSKAARDQLSAARDAEKVVKKLGVPMGFTAEELRTNPDLRAAVRRAKAPLSPIEQSQKQLEDWTNRYLKATAKAGGSLSPEMEARFEKELARISANAGPAISQGARAAPVRSGAGARLPSGPAGNPLAGQGNAPARPPQSAAGPPAPAGSVATGGLLTRLYRSQHTHESRPGLFWTESLETAKRYQAEGLHPNHLLYVDVPTAELEQYRAKNTSMASVARDPHNDFFLPEALANRAEAVRGEATGRVLEDRFNDLFMMAKQLGLPVNKLISEFGTRQADPEKAMLWIESGIRQLQQRGATIPPPRKKITIESDREIRERLGLSPPEQAEQEFFAQRPEQRGLFEAQPSGKPVGAMPELPTRIPEEKIQAKEPIPKAMIDDLAAMLLVKQGVNFRYTTEVLKEFGWTGPEIRAAQAQAEQAAGRKLSELKTSTGLRGSAAQEHAGPIKAAAREAVIRAMDPQGVADVEQAGQSVGASPGEIQAVFRAFSEELGTAPAQAASETQKPGGIAPTTTPAHLGGIGDPFVTGTFDPSEFESPGRPEGRGGGIAGAARAFLKEEAGHFDPAEFKKGALELVDDVRRWLAPASRGPHARQMAGIARENFARLAQKTALARAALEAGRQFFEKRMAEAKDDAERNARFLEFTDAIEEGRISSLPPEQRAIAQAIRDMLDAREQQLKDRDLLNTFVENYFGHLWKDPRKSMSPGDIGAFMASKRPLAGRESFRKQRSIPTYREGIDLGFEPVSWNPVDLALLKMREIDKSIMGRDVFTEAQRVGLTQFVRIGQRGPAGWIPLNDKLGKAFAGRQGGLVQTGNHWMPEPAATLLHNYLAPGLWGRSSIYGLARTYSNAMNQFQLGFSAFHLGLVSLDAQVSAAALAVQQLSRGQIGNAVTNALRAAVPLLPAIRNYLQGNRFLREYFAPGSQGSEMMAMVEQSLRGGYQPMMDKFYGGEAIEAFRKSIRDLINKKPAGVIGVAWHALPAIGELVSKPIMEHIVPRMKAGVLMDMINYEMQRIGGNAPIEAQREAINKAAQSVENRLGQLTYDNLFWHRTLKDMAMLMVRSVGWNVGTWREGLGAVKDIPSSIRGTATGQGVSPRLAYAIALPIVVAFFSALYQYLRTGKPPEEGLDYFAPRTGEQRPDGTPDRVWLPSYMRDVQQVWNRADEGPFRIFGNIFEMGRHKLNPGLTSVVEMLENRDFYGRAIVAPEDTQTQRAYYLSQHLINGFEPLVLRTARQREEQGLSSTRGNVEAFFGITPAPAYGTRSWETQRQLELNRRYEPSPLERLRRERARTESPSGSSSGGGFRY